MSETLAAVQDIESKLSRFGEPCTYPDLRKTFSALTAVWRGLVEVDVSIDAQTLGRVSVSGSCTLTLVELAGESVTNAE